MWGRLFFPVLERRWSGNMRITESMGYKGEKRTKKAGTGSENPYMGSHRPVPAAANGFVWEHSDVITDYDEIQF